MRRRIVFFALLLQIVLASIVFAETTQITNGLNYLFSTQSADGSWTAGEESAIATAEAIETLRLLNQTGTASYTNASSWLQSQSLESTNHLAERICILAAGGNDSSLLIFYLDEIVRVWGGYDDFTVDNLDTASALQALKSINYSNQTTIQSAINYLLSHQNTDGGWGFDSGDASNIYMTAIVSRTLQLFAQTTAIATVVNKATSFITSRQNSDGSFGSSVYETALAYIALVAVTTDNTVLGKAAQYITNTQVADGSWNEDPYITARALQALYYSANKPQPPAPTLATVTGTVMDASTNQVLQGALAALQSNTAINATSNASGVFTLNNIPSGSQTISISLAGYATSTVTVNAIEGAVINLGNIPLSVIASKGIIKGTVTDAATAQPLGGVNISVTGAYSATTSTGADGSFIFTGVTTGSVTITASLSGYYTNTGTGSVTAGGVIYFSPQLTTTPPSGTTGKLIGKVVSGTTGNPIEGAVVSIDSSAAVSTDAQGSFSIDGIAAGTHQVKAIASGYGAVSYSVIIPAGSTSDMGVIIMSASTGSSLIIKGVVRDSSTNKPIALADVSIVGTSLTTKTATDGSYTITGIEQLSFSVRASASGYNSKTIPVNTSQYGTYALDIALDQSSTSGLKITSLSLDNTKYTANTFVMINATLENTTSSAFKGCVYIKVTDKQNNIVGLVHVYESPNNLNIAPNSSVPISAGWNVRRNIPGNYLLTLSILDLSHSVLTESSVPFEIIPSVAVENLDLSVEPQFVDVSITKSIDLAASFNNRSNTEATVKAKYEVKDVGGNIIKNGETDIDLELNDDVVTLDLVSFTSTFNQSGKYPVNVKIFSGNVIIAENTDGIYVAPPVKIQPTRTYTPDSVLPGADKTVNVNVKLKGVTAPTIISATSDTIGDKITLSFNRSMADPAGKQAQFNIKADGVTIPVSTASLNQFDNKKIDLLLQSSLVRGQNVLLNYLAGDMQSADGMLLANVVNYLVENNAQPMIFNQDGLGFSGMIRGNPLKGNITMTGYNSWPDGFSKGTYSFVSGVFDGQNVWMIPRDANMVIKIDKDTGNMTGYNNWPAGFSPGSDMFNSSVFDGQNIWMIPLNADRVIKIDKDTGVMTGYSNWPAGFNKGYMAFIGAVFDGQNIWMIPYSADSVIKIDKNTGVMKAYKNWPTGFSKGAYSFQGAVFDGQDIWMIPFYADRVVKINKDTGVMTGYSNWPAGFSKGTGAFVGGVFDGQNIWMIPYNADRVIKIDKDTGNMSGYANWPSGVNAGRLGGVFDGQNIWMIPHSVNAVVKIDKDTGSMNSYTGWPPGLISGSLSFYGGVSDGQNLWMIPASANMVIKLSSGVESAGYIYNVADDFSGTYNPNGAWSYGWSSTLYSSMNLFTSAGYYSNGIIAWTDPNTFNSNIPAVAHNTTTNVINTGTVTVQPLQVWFHPGPNGEYAHIRWKAHSAGEFSVAAGFSGVDYAYPTSTDVHILYNNTEIYSNLISDYGTVKSYTNKITVNKGDIIDFAVGCGSNGQYYGDSTGVAVEIAISLQALSNVRVIDTISNINIDVDQNSFSKAPYSITAGSDSTAVEWRYDSIVVDHTEDLNYNILLKNPLAGENRLVNNKLAVTYADINENEVKTELPASYIKVLTSAFDSSIATDKQSYQASEDVKINAAITSKSDYARTIDAKILIEDSQGVLVEQAADLSGLSFAAGEKKTFNNIIFNTGTTLVGNYRVHLILYDNQLKVGEALANFAIQQPAGSASVSSSISTDKMSYNANETVAITGAVQNTTANMILNNLTARVTVSNTGGTVLYTEDLPIAILTSGQLNQLKCYWSTSANPPGSYNVKLEVLDSVNLLSTSTASLAIAGTATGGTGVIVSGLQGTISVTPTSVYVGNDVSVGYTVTNNGNEDITLLRIKILIVDPVTQTIKAEIPDQQALAKGASVIGVGLNSISTTNYVPGTYMAILQVATPAMTEFKTLTKANFEVKAGLDISKKIPDITKLLIWINTNCNQVKNSENMVVACCSSNGSVCTRIDLLERLLKNASVKYLIVYTKNDFQRSLRNSYFTDYLILGNHQPLEAHYAYELRELVHSGKGLIASLFVDEGTPNTPLAGLKVNGYLPSATRNISLIDSAIASSMSFASAGKAAKTETLTGAVVAGWISDVHLPAVVLNDYGLGRSIYYAFDLGATLNDQNYETLANLITNSITYIHKPLIENSFLPDQFVPVEVTIKSLGGIFDLKIKETYPEQIKIYNPITGLWVTENPWTQDMHIESNETKYFRYYALTPDVSATYTLNTEVGYMKDDVFQLYKEVDTNITVVSDSAVYIDSIISALDVLPVSNKDGAHVSNAIKYMERVKDRQEIDTKSAFEDNIQDILKAVEAIMNVTSCDTTQVRLVMDMLLQIYQGKYYFG